MFLGSSTSLYKCCYNRHEKGWGRVFKTELFHNPYEGYRIRFHLNNSEVRDLNPIIGMWHLDNLCTEKLNSHARARSSGTRQIFHHKEQWGKSRRHCTGTEHLKLHRIQLQEQILAEKKRMFNNLKEFSACLIAAPAWQKKERLALYTDVFPSWEVGAGERLLRTFASPITRYSIY